LLLSQKGFFTSLLTIIDVKDYSAFSQMKYEIGLVLEILIEVLLVEDGRLLHRAGIKFINQIDELKKHIETAEKGGDNFMESAENHILHFIVGNI